MIRLATVADAAQIAAIYAPFCVDSVVSFEEMAPSTAEMAGRISGTLERLPWLVHVGDDGHVRGYAYAGPHRDRAAYRWSADVSAYIHKDWRRRGLGRALYERLFQLLSALGYYNVFAGVTLPNAASVGLHESMGFVPVGVYRRVGYKFGAWHDTGWWQRPLQPPAVNPKTPRLLPEALDDLEFRKLIFA
jgi:phosphinothricin acetyltransferase